MVTRNVHIDLLPKKLEVEGSDYWSIYFKRPGNFVFEAGDWIDIQFKSKTLKGGITYSVSSSPTESDLRITFRHGISEFKRALQSITDNDQMYISQYGNDYGFHLKKNRSSTLIAGGVGIAPFRSMIKEMYDTNSSNEITLIYLNQNENFLFKNELNTWKKQLSNLNIIYIVTRDFNRKKREKLILSSIKTASDNFYISGPPTMVEANEHLLIDTGVNLRNIRIDSFGGY